MYVDYRYPDWAVPYQLGGHKIIVDHLWDSYVHEPATVQHNVLTLRAQDWIWIHEATWYQHLGYGTRTPAQPDRLFLLLMNLKKPHRDALFQLAQPWLDRSLYSYQGTGHTIENDIDPGQGNWQRYYNPEWYSRTAFSLVSESTVDTRLWISEKSFKPLAHQHAFLIYGSPGTLAWLKQQGFESFGHVVDESYDTIPQPRQRLLAVIQQVQTLAEHPELFADAESRARIEHNHNHFYNQQRISNMFYTQIITPIKEFLNA